MKPLVLRIVLLGCAGWTLTAWAGPDEEAVEQTIRSAAKAAATFSDTRDRQAILKLYASDYEGVQDGESESRAAIEKWLADYEAELKQGSTLRFIGSVSNLKTQVQGATAWARYDYVFQAIRNGEIEGQDVGKCTNLLRKDPSGWVIVHEHCSKTRLNQDLR